MFRLAKYPTPGLVLLLLLPAFLILSYFVFGLYRLKILDQQVAPEE